MPALCVTTARCLLVPFPRCHAFMAVPQSLVPVLFPSPGWGLPPPEVYWPRYPEHAGFTGGLSLSVLARNALVVSFAALVAYSFEVTGYQPFVLTGKTPEGLPDPSIPPFSVATTNGTISFTQMVQVGRGGSLRRPRGPALSPCCVGLAPGS